MSQELPLSLAMKWAPLSFLALTTVRNSSSTEPFRLNCNHRPTGRHPLIFEQEVFVQLQAANPGTTAHHLNPEDVQLLAPRNKVWHISTSFTSTTPLTYSQGQLLCLGKNGIAGQDWIMGRYNDANSCITFLNDLQAFAATAGPRTCVSIACEKTVGVWLCNDVSPTQSHVRLLPINH